jgi:hypothetical protein
MPNSMTSWLAASLVAAPGDGTVPRGDDPLADALAPGRLRGGWRFSDDIAVVRDYSDHTYCPTVAAAAAPCMCIGVCRAPGRLDRRSFTRGFRRGWFRRSAISFDGPRRFVATAPGEDVAAANCGGRPTCSSTTASDGVRRRRFCRRSSPGAHYGFGLSVEFRGDTLVVGGPQYIVEGIGAAGAVYVFREEDGRWEFKQLLVAPDPRLGARFGVAIAMDDEWLVVGARLDNEGGHNAGAVYIYRQRSEGFLRLREQAAGAG